MSQEITIHSSIDHKHVVKFYSYFEDKDFIYIILEICNKRVSPCECCQIHHQY